MKITFSHVASTMKFYWIYRNYNTVINKTILHEFDKAGTLKVSNTI